MNKELKTKLANAVLEAPSACPEFKAAAEKLLAAIGTDEEVSAGLALVAEAEEDIVPIDGCIAFMQSDKAKELFGAEGAAAAEAHMKDIKAQGAQYCDCPGCTAAAAIIDNKDAFGE